VAGVSVLAGSRDRTFDISFAPQFVKGAYAMVLGPAIFDTAGNAMNQDQDATGGEVPDDRHTVSFVIGDVQVLRSSDVPVALPMFSTSTSTLAVIQDLSIADLDVQVDVSYPDAGLLGLTLVSPAGTRVSLATTRDFLGPNYDDTIFDDEASQSINEGTPPYSGSYRPASPLSVLDNTSTQGTWTLEVRAPWFYTGSLNAWSLRVIPHPPRLSVGDIAIAEGDSGSTSATFMVSLSSAVGDTVTVDFATVAGTASAGGDYEDASGTVTFAPGELSKLISVTVHGDTLDEPDESFFVNLSNATNAALAEAQAEATIRNDEARLSINDVTLVEGATGTTNAAFTVSLSTASNQTTSVNYATANGTATAGSDYSSASGVLDFAPGESS
jgi:subtilisin-like proprotein convertase family protein